MIAGANRILTFCVLIGGAVSLAACGSAVKSGSYSSNADDGQGSYRIGRPYSIDGKTYYPAEDMNYSETGIASWYGPGFHGNRTANGEVYDQYQVSAAHKTLPMPSIVRVTNLDNGRSVMARINDRGPFVPGRIIDMSRAGAHEIGLDVSGTARVRVEIMRRESEIVKQIAMEGGGRDAQLAALTNPPADGTSDQQIAAAAPIDRSVTVQTLAPPPGTASEQPVPSAALAPAPAPQAAVWPSQSASQEPPPQSSPAPSAPAPRTEPAVASPAPPPAVMPAVASTQSVSPQPKLEQASWTVPASGRIFVQAGAFSQLDNAEKLRRRLAGLGNASVTPITVGGRELYRVRIGPLADDAAADQMLGRVLNAGIREARVVVD